MSKSIKEKTLMYLNSLKYLSEFTDGFTEKNYKQKFLDLDIVSKLHNYPSIQEYIFDTLYGKWKHEYANHYYLPQIHFILMNDGSIMLNVSTMDTYHSSKLDESTPRHFQRTFMGSELKILENLAEEYIDKYLTGFFKTFTQEVNGYIETVIDKLRRLPYNNTNLIKLFRELNKNNLKTYIDDIIKAVEKLDTLGVYESFKDVCNLYNYSLEENERKNVLKTIIEIEDWFDTKLVGYSFDNRMTYRDLRRYNNGGNVTIYTIGYTKPLYVMFTNYEIKICSDNKITYDDFDESECNLYNKIKYLLETRWRKPEIEYGSRI